MEKSFVTKQDIIIPAGTALEEIKAVSYGTPHYEGYIAFGNNHTAFFHVDIDNIKEFPEIFEDKNDGSIKYSQILFSPREEGQALACYEVGLMGCTEIKEKLYGKDENGLDITSYIVSFENAKPYEISPALSVR
jgi:hypothetical protein